MTAKEYLSQARLLDARINAKIQQVAALNDLATHATATLTGMPRNPNRSESRMAEAVVKIVDLQNEINHDIDELVDELNNMETRVVFLGDGVPVYSERIAERMTVPFSFAPAHINRQRAAAVAALGCIYYEEGRIETAEEHAPDYLRKPQAEREREAGTAPHNFL